jgi:hypothetical protein
MKKLDAENPGKRCQPGPPARAGDLQGNQTLRTAPDMTYVRELLLVVSTG